MFAENVRGLPSRYPGHGRELADGFEETFAFLDRMHQEALPGGASLPAWKWLRSMTEHEIHHRGQIYLLLGLLGIATPPLRPHL